MSRIPPLPSLLLSTALAACSTTTTGPDSFPEIPLPPPPTAPTPAQQPILDAAGTWIVTRVVTAASGPCAPQVDSKTTEPIQIYQSGTYPTYQVTAAGYAGEYDSFLSGILKKTRYMYLDGRYPKDGGTLIAKQVLSFPDENTLTGTEVWVWSGPGGTCQNGTASIVAKRGF
jgi:hypothetical protein